MGLLLKLILGSLIPLAADENYYWVWSQNLQLSYFDHPAMIAWLLKLGEPFINLGSGVRWPTIFLGHITCLIWLHIVKPSLSPEKLRWFLLIFIFSPMLGFGSLIATPDLPLVFFWSLAMYLLLELNSEHHSQKSKFALSAILGITLGLGFCSKYHIVLFVPAALAYLSFEKKWKHYNIYTLLTLIACGLFGSLPVLIWNYNNGFASFLFQINHGLGRPQWNPYWTYSYPVGQILLIFPLLFWYFLKNNSDERSKIFKYFAWTPLIFFFISSFRGLVEMNWPIVAFPSVYALATINTKTLKPLKITILFWIGLSILIFTNVFKISKFGELSYYKPTLDVVGKFQPLYAENYQMASYIWYQTKSPMYKLFQMSRRDFFDELPGSKPRSNLFYVIMDKDAGLPNWLTVLNPKVTIEAELPEPFVLNKIEIQP